MQFIVCIYCGQRNTNFNGPCEYCGAPLENIQPKYPPIAETIKGISITSDVVNYNIRLIQVFRDGKVIGKFRVEDWLIVYDQQQLERIIARKLAQILGCDPAEIYKLSIFKVDYRMYQVKEN